MWLLKGWVRGDNMANTACFLAQDNHCGQTWLQLVSKGNAIIAELMRLKDHIPPIFKLESKADQIKYANLIDDFSYFEKQKKPKPYDGEENEKLKEWDEDLKENLMDLLQRFYKAFESIHTFGTDINYNVEALERGDHIEQNLETVFASIHGKQLLCEALYLFGVMLIVVDLHIPGVIRERLLVSYYRYRPQDRGDIVPIVCRLLRSRGPNDQLLTNYFQRFELKRKYVQMVIGHLKSEDIYNQLSAYPHPEQQTTALASQASMLYVCLFFSPKTLFEEYHIMRSIVDRFFPDNWVINVYMGLTVNLVDIWEAYPAARKALANTMNNETISRVAEFHRRQLSDISTKTQGFLKEGRVVKDNILDLVPKLTKLIRDCNVTLRWLILHTLKVPVTDNGKKYKQIQDKNLVNSAEFIYQQLLDTAELELKVKDLVQTLLTEKSYNWDIWKSECETRMVELSEIYLGKRPLFGVSPNENISTWLLTIKPKLSELSIEEASTGTLVRLINALNEVLDYHQLRESLQVKQLLSDVVAFLQKMMQAAKVKEEDLINLQKVGDLSYAWELIDAYTPYMQRNIKRKPAIVSKLRSTFLKLSSAVEIPLLRISTSKSADFESVSNYYYNELVIYVGKVLQVIPAKMFELLSQIVDLQTSKIQEVPLRLDKDKLNVYAQLEDRTKVAALTQEVSVLSEGVFEMKNTLVGVVRIDPKQLLQDGIKKELVNKIGLALHEGLVFNPKKGDELPQKLQNLGQIMDGYRRSFEYIQDYIGIQGMKIWQQGLVRVIGFYTDLEANPLKRVKLLPWESHYQSKYIPIPQFKSLDQNSETCMGRLLRELIRITKATETNYNMTTTTWYDVKKTKDSKLRICADMSLFKMINSAVGNFGLHALDRLICFMITSELQNYIAVVKSSSMRPEWQGYFASVLKEMPPSPALVENPNKVYPKWVVQSSKMCTVLLEKVLKIGQFQLLRVHFYLELVTSSVCSATKLHNALRNMNKMLLIEAENPELKDKTAMYLEVSQLMEACGIVNALGKLFVTTYDVKYFSLTTFVFVITQLPKLKLNRDAGWMIGSQLDGWPLVIGVQTLFRQVHPELQDQFIMYMAQYVNSFMKAFTSSKLIEKEQKLPHEVAIGLTFLVQYCEVSGYPRTHLKKYIPEIILNLYGSLISDSA